MNSGLLWPDHPQIRNLLLKLNFYKLCSFLYHFNGYLPASVIKDLLELHGYNNEILWRALLICRKGVSAGHGDETARFIIDCLKHVSKAEVIDVITENYLPDRTVTAGLLQSLTEKVLSKMERSSCLEYGKSSQRLALKLLQHYLSCFQEPDTRWVASMFAKTVLWGDGDEEKCECNMKELTETIAGYSHPHPFLLWLFWKRWLEFIDARDDDDLGRIYNYAKALVYIMRRQGGGRCPVPETASVISSGTLEKITRSVFECDGCGAQLEILLLGSHIVLYTDEERQRKWWELLTRLPEDFLRRSSCQAEKTPRGERLTLYQALVRNINLVQYEFLLSRILLFICPADDVHSPDQAALSRALVRWNILFPDPPAGNSSLPSVWSAIWRFAKSKLSLVASEWKNRTWGASRGAGDSRLSPLSFPAATLSPISPDHSFIRELLVDFVCKNLKLPRELRWAMSRCANFYQRLPSVRPDLKEALSQYGISFSDPSASISSSPSTSFGSPPCYQKLMSDRFSRYYSGSGFLEVTLKTNRRISSSSAEELRKWLAFLLTRAMMRFPIRIRYLAMYDLIVIAAYRYLDIAGNGGEGSDPSRIPAAVPFDVWLEDRLFSRKGNGDPSGPEIHPPMKSIYREVLAVVSDSLNLRLASSSSVSVIAG